MSDLPGIVITGASGRMGQMLMKTVLASDKARLVGAVERPGHDWIGRDAGAAMGGAAVALHLVPARGAGSTSPPPQPPPTSPNLPPRPAPSMSSAPPDSDRPISTGWNGPPITR